MKSFHATLILVVALVAIAAAGREVKEVSDSGQIPSSSGLRSIPVVYIKSDMTSDKRYNFAFQNETGDIFRYMPDSGGRATCATLELSLFSENKLVQDHAPTPTPPAFVESRVQTLKPNEALEGELLLGHYRDLKPGRYEIRARYDVAKTHHGVEEFGLTPLQFERTVMILYIEE